MDLLVRLAGDEGAGVVIVTHDPRVAAYAKARRHRARRPDRHVAGRGVIGLSLSLMVGGGRRAAIRLLLIVAGVAAGTVFLLGALAIGPARDRADARVAERQGPVGAPPSDHRPALLWAAFQTSPSEIGGRGLEVVEVAATGPGAPRPLGAARTPAPGEVFVSPALGRLLESDRGRVYRLRFPGRIDGTLGRAVLHDPDELVAMVGMAPDRLAGATRITDWAAAQPPSEAQTGNTFNRRLVYLLAALGDPDPDRGLRRGQHPHRRDDARAAVRRDAARGGDAAAGRARRRDRSSGRCDRRRARRARARPPPSNSRRRRRGRRLFDVPGRPVAAAVADRARPDRDPRARRRGRAGLDAASRGDAARRPPPPGARQAVCPPADPARGRMGRACRGRSGGRPADRGREACSAWRRASQASFWGS